MIPISVIIPVYNAEFFLSDTIESVLNQSFADFELIIIDDGSYDNSSEIILSFDDKRIRYFQFKNDFIGTRNKGLKIAQGKYIAQLDHDDLMIPDRLRMQYNYMETHTDIAACGGYMECFGQYISIWKIPLEPDDLLPYTIIHTPILNPTGFIRREILMKYNIKHRRGYSYAEDFKFWTDIIKIGKLANIPEVLVKYRTSDIQTSKKNLHDWIESSLKIQNEMFNYFLNHINKNDSYGKKILYKWVPVINQMGKSGYLSSSYFYNILYELVLGMLKDGIIKIVMK